jgi:2-oxoglutarate dehydrogenase complex dehydrogenase (E1) component-like enzyme
MYRFLSKQSYTLLNTPKQYFSEIAKFQNSFLSTTNIEYIENLYEKWLADKKSVSPSFAAYFELLERGDDPHDAYQHPATIGQLGLDSNK